MASVSTTTEAATKLPIPSGRIEDEAVLAGYLKSVTWMETRMQISLAWPLILGNLLSFLLQLVSTTFVGHTGSLELSAASLAYSFSVVTGYSVLVGLSGAMETLCGQAFGAREYQKLGVYMQRSMVVLNVLAVPIAILWVYMDQIFEALGQEAELASKAGAYGVWLIPTLFAYSFYACQVRFLQAQSLVKPLFVCFSITVVCHVPICWALVFHSGLGYKGAAIANSISLWITVFALEVYIRCSKRCARCIAPLSFAAVRDMRGFLALAVPSAMMVCLEWWSYEVLVIISAFLANPELTTGIIAICVNSETLLYNIPMGMASAVSTRLSNELGAGNAKAAGIAVNVAKVLALVEALVVVVFLLAVQNVWGWVYSNDEEVVTLIAGYIPFFAASSAFDALQAVLSGVVRGAGWQRAGAFMNLSSFYIAGLPIGCLLAFVAHLGGKGLWTGLIVGTFVQFVTYAVFTWLMDWDKEVKEAAKRLGMATSLREPLLV
ncbi:hypothetical protein GOP47_0024545 [Adiantum capillus-veneris]|uniref:Protein DETOXIFICATION n=1 Tax=Adiantum capillus-veneris TaxID=13818 RepID=A0A9D4U2C3_ADICA|nr:hypothetical protein GOP47_0024545 [Adiantum capillus-veneris]